MAPRSHRLDRHRNISVSCDEDDRDLLVGRDELALKIKAASPWQYSRRAPGRLGHPMARTGEILKLTQTAENPGRPIATNAQVSLEAPDRMHQ